MYVGCMTQAAKRTTRCPWQVLSGKFLCELKSVGLPAEVRDLESLAFAPKVAILPRSPRQCSERRERMLQELERRCARWMWVPRVGAGAVLTVGRMLYKELVASLLKPFCFGWCTTRRCHNDAEDCRLCGGPLS